MMLLVALAFILGYVFSKMQSKSWASIWVWLLPVTNVSITYFYSASFAPSTRMLLLISLLFLGMKAVSIVYRYPGKSKLNFTQWSCFALGWPGMDPTPFETLGLHKLNGSKHLVSGVKFFLLGTLLLFLLAYSLKFYEPSVYQVCLMSFVPFVMIFHLGLFNIGAAFWAYMGVLVMPLMDAPWKARTLSEFWGKRWNIAFIQMTRITVFLPLAKRINTTVALVSSFVISGLFHEVALTLPVAKGFGLPLGYFVLQVIFIKIEKTFLRARGNAVKRIWTFGCLLLPFPMLFHPAFVTAVFLPLLHALV